MFIRSVLTCLVNHIAEDCCESLGCLSHMSGHTWVRIQQIYCTLETTCILTCINCVFTRAAQYDETK